MCVCIAYALWVRARVYCACVWCMLPCLRQYLASPSSHGQSCLCFSLSLSLLGCVHVYVRNLGVSLFFSLFFFFWFRIENEQWNFSIVLFVVLCVSRAVRSISSNIWNSFEEESFNLCSWTNFANNKQQQKKSIPLLHGIHKAAEQLSIALYLCKREQKQHNIKLGFSLWSNKTVKYCGFPSTQSLAFNRKQSVWKS